MKLSLKQIVDPKHTVLLIIDMQRDFLNDDGKTGKAGKDLSSMQAVIEPIKRLASFARQVNVPIIFTQMIDGLKYRDEVGKYRFLKKGKTEKSILCLERSDGVEFTGITPTTSDRVIIKHKYCCFSKTALEDYLKKNNTKTLIVTGVKTNACVESTVRTAYHKGYFVVVPSNCVASDDLVSHKQTLINFERYFGDVVLLEDILKSWG